MRRATMNGALILTSSLLAGINAWGTITQFQDVDQLTANADVVIHGQVQSLRSSWAGTTIVTHVQVQVSEKLKGEVGSVVDVVQPGGEVGDIGQHVEGLAEFTAGEEVVLFLKRNSPAAATFHVCGLSQGKYTVEQTSDGKNTFVIPSVIDAELVDAHGFPALDGAKPVEMQRFRKQVHDAVKKSSPTRSKQTP